MRVELRAVGQKSASGHLTCELSIAELINIVERNAKLVGTLESWIDELDVHADGEDFAGLEL